LADLESLGVSVHQSLDEFYQESGAGLAVISSPIQLHAEHTCQALAHGSHVLVEKPAAAVTADVDRMVVARNRFGLFVAVGFQWSFARTILQLKRDIIAGRFGAPLAGRCLTLWPRTEAYYQRNSWAGRKRDSQGRWILDSPASNAMAHFLHNLLFLLGDELDSSAVPVNVIARLARANDIETFDTIATQVLVRHDVQLFFLASHTVAEDEVTEPKFQLEFEDATVEFSGGDAPMNARLRNGTVLQYESPNATTQAEKLWHCVEAIESTSAIPCGLETARPHTQCIEMIEQGSTGVIQYGPEAVERGPTAAGPLRWVPGLADTLHRAYLDGQLPDLRRVT
jgi:predicted dehydrogenase